MPFSLDILPWWGWLVCALALRLVSWFFSSLYESAKYSRSGSKWELASEWSLATIFWVGAALCGLIGLVGLAKWVYGIT